LVELAFVYLQTRTLADVGTGVVHQDVDASELARGSCDQVFEIGEAADVTRDRPRSRPDLACHLVDRLLLTAADNNPSALADEGLRNGASDAAARAGDDRDFVIENAHALLISCGRAQPAS